MADIRAASYDSKSAELYASIPHDIPHGKNAAMELPGCYPHNTLGPIFSQARPIQNTDVSPLEAEPFIPPTNAEEHSQFSAGNWSSTASEKSHAQSTMGIPSSMTSPWADQKEAVTAQDYSRTRSQIARTILSSSSFKYDKSNTIHHTAASLVDELARVVHVLNQGWMNKLGSLFLPAVIEKYFATHSPFENGIEAWQQCFRTPIPRTLREIFSLLRVAVAAAHLLHHEDNCWDIFYKNVRQWSGVIADSEEKELFLKAADILLTRPDSPNVTFLQLDCQCPRQVTSLQADSGEIRANWNPRSGPASPGLAGYEHSSRSFDMQTSVIQSHHSLVHGPVLTMCALYLDCKCYPAFLYDPTLY